MGYYVIKFMSEHYTLQEETMYYVQISTSVELAVKSQYMNFMKYNTKWYWYKKTQQKISLFLHTQFYIHD